jgi:hypothetical protein
MVKHITRTIVILLLLIIAATIAALVWLRQETRSLEWARPTIIRALNPQNAPYVVNYTDAIIDWRDWSQLGLLQVKNVTITERDGAAFATLPAVYISFSPFGMLTGGRMLHTVSLYKPKLFLTRDEDKVLRVGLESDHAIPLTHLMAFFGNSDSKKFNLSDSLPFKRLIIDRASLSFTDAVSGASISSTRATLRFSRNGSSLEASASLPFLYKKQLGNIDATLRRFNRDDTHVLNASLDRVPAELGCMMIRCGDGVSAQGMLNGKILIALDEEINPASLDINMHATKAVFTVPTMFPEPLAMNRGLVQLKASQNMRLVNLSRLSLVTEDTTFEVAGIGRRSEEGWHVDANANTTKPIAVQKVYKYWPLPLAPHSRAWVLGALKGGRAEDLYLTLKLSPDDFKAEYVSDGAVKAEVSIKNLTADYLPGFPHIRNAETNAHFTGTTATVDVTSGATMTGTTIQHAVVLFPDLNKLGTPVEIVSTLRSPAVDVATLLALKHFTFDDALGLNPGSISGSLDTMLSLKFNAFSGDLLPENSPKTDAINFDQVAYNISAQLHNVAQEKLAGKLSVKGMNGLLNATNAGMDFDGVLTFSDATALSVKIAQKSGEDVTIAANGSIGRKQLVELGAPDGDYFGEGVTTINAQLVAQKKGVVVDHVQADFTDMALAIPELSWTKKRGIAASASVSSDPSGAATEQRYTGKVHADDLKIPDLLLTLDGNQQLKSIAMPSVVTARNRFAMDYRARDDGFDISLHGKRLDMSDSFSQQGGGSLENFPPIGLTLDLAELVLTRAAPLTNVKGTLSCTSKRCDSANINADIGNHRLNASIVSKGGIRQLLITASDAGDFLRAIDFTDRMYRGSLEIKGSYDDNVQPPLFSGTTSIRDFTLKNSAILGRIFSIGSLTGLQNALTGSGIAFEKLTAELTHRAGMITVNKGAASGNAMGITVGGTIDSSEAEIDLKGVIVPAYALNSLIGKIPLIGAIAGGEGEGLIAFNYKISGSYSKPDVRVNALSGLTPGFLRGIFSIFDSKEKKSEAPVASDRPAKETQ